MTELYISLGCILIMLGFIFASYKLSNKIMRLVLKIASLVLFAFYFYFVFQPDFIESVTIGVNNIFSNAELAWINILRWLNNVCVLVAILAPWFKVKTFDNILAFVAPVIFILDVVFYRLHCEALLGADFALTDTNAILFAIEIGIMGAFAGYYLFRKIKDRDFNNICKQLGLMAGILPLLMLSVFPQNFLFNFLGEVGEGVEDFTLVHRIYIYLAVLLPVALTFLFRKADESVRRSVLVWIAMAGFNQYFFTYTFNMSLGGLPLHLCNTAIVLIMIAYIFKCKPVFYFTYFVNVIGAMFAILLPNTATPMTAISSLHFWFNHWYAFFAPILGITLKIFPRPNFKMMRGAIYIFTIYLVAMAVLNGVINAMGYSVDYFFLYENFIVGKFEFLRPIKEGFVWSFAVGDGTAQIFWLYDIIVWVAYVFMMFITWLVYSYCYKISDHYSELRALYKIDLLGIRELKKKMKGRPITEPIDLKGVNMIQFEHFSKRYGNAKNYSVHDFNLTVNDGEVFGFLGHNGSGKSTTIKSLVGIQSITEGRILVCGYDIEKQPLEAKRLIGYVSDNHAVYEHLTGREYINYVADLYDVSAEDRTARMDRYVEMFNLKDAIDREIKGYSHGMKQKVMVISSLIHDPKVWVLDEPLTGLDPTSAYQIKQCMIEHARRGNIVFFSSHVIEVVEKVCDRIAIIKKGELQGVYSLKELKKDNISLEELYLGNMEGTTTTDIEVSGAKLLDAGKSATQTSGDETAETSTQQSNSANESVQSNSVKNMQQLDSTEDLTAQQPKSTKNSAQPVSAENSQHPDSAKAQTNTADKLAQPNSTEETPQADSTEEQTKKADSTKEQAKTTGPNTEETKEISKAEPDSGNKHSFIQKIKSLKLKKAKPAERKIKIPPKKTNSQDKGE